MTDIATGFKQILASFPVRSREDCDALRKAMDGLQDRLMEDPTLINGEVLDAIAAVAGASEHQDINETGSPQHRSTRQRITIFHAMQFLDQIAGNFPEQAAPAVARLEALAQDNLDWDVRREAVMVIWGLSTGEAEPAQTLAVETLERQAKVNSNSTIRATCRDNLLMTIRHQPKWTARAWAAQAEGVQDRDPEARDGALAMLNNRVNEPDCSDDEAEKLIALFRKAVEKAGDGAQAGRLRAEKGIGDIQTRRMNELAERGCTTTETVTPLKPVKFKSPGK